MWLSAERWCWGALELGHRELVLGTEISPVASVLSPVSPAGRPGPCPSEAAFLLGAGPGFQLPRLQVLARMPWRPQPCGPVCP